MPRGSCQLSLQRTRGDLEDAPASHGCAPTIQQDLRSHNLTLLEAMDMAENRSLWRMWLTYGTTQSWAACQKWQQRVMSVINICNYYLRFFFYQPALPCLLYCSEKVFSRNLGFCWSRFLQTGYPKCKVPKNCHFSIYFGTFWVLWAFYAEILLVWRLLVDIN